MKSGTNAAQTISMIWLYGADMTNEGIVCFWVAWFRSGNFERANKPRRQSQLKENYKELRAIIEADSSQMYEEIVSIVSFNQYGQYWVKNTLAPNR